MTDFSTLVDYENPYELHIKSPVDGKYTGIVFKIVSADSAPVVKAQRDLQIQYFKDRALKGDDVEVPDQESALLSAAIVDWTWGGGGWGHVVDGSPATKDNKDFVLNHPNAGWIKNQVSAACANIENFTQRS